MPSISGIWKTLPMLALASSLPLLTSCTTIHTTATTDKGVCAVWSALDYSAKSDTRETVLGVRQNNAKHDAYCG